MAKEKGSSLLDSIKNQIKKSGNSKSSTFFVKPGEKARVRFLKDFEEGTKITFHDSFEKGINTPCLKHFGEKCPHCKDKKLRTRDFYAWPIYDYGSKKERLFLYAVNSFTPIPALVNMFEAYGTITDRDFVISRNGKGTDTNYGVVPMDKVKFKKKNVKPFSKKKILEILKAAFDVFEDDDDMDDEEELDDEELDDEELDDEDNEDDDDDSDEDDDDDSDDEDSDDDEDDDDEEESAKESLEDLSGKQLKKVAKELGMKKDKINSFKKKERLIAFMLKKYDEDDILDTIDEL